MDLALHLRVLWRFRYLVLCGILLATCLSFLTFVRVSISEGSINIGYRQSEVWKSSVTLFLTQDGFPWGRAFQGYLPADVDKGQPPVPIGDTNRLSSLATLYAQLASSDAVRRIMLRDGPLRGGVSATTLAPSLNYSGPPLPLISIEANGPTPTDAVHVARRGTAAFLTYLDEQQSDAGIPRRERVIVQVIQRPAGAALVEGRRKTLPMIVFMTTMLAVFGLAFVLENLRPRMRGVVAARDHTISVGDARRSA